MMKSNDKSEGISDDIVRRAGKLFIEQLLTEQTVGYAHEEQPHPDDLSNQVKAGTSGPLAPDNAMSVTGTESPLRKIHFDILTHLGHTRSPQHQEEIAAEVDASRKTVSNRLRELEEHGLVERPHGTRGGYAVTDRGRQVLQSADGSH